MEIITSARGLVGCLGVRATCGLLLRCHWLSWSINWFRFKVLHFCGNEWPRLKVLHFLDFRHFVVGSNDEPALGGYLSGYCMVELRQRPMRWLLLLRLLVELLLEGLLAAILVVCRVLVLAVDMVSWPIGVEVHRRPFISISIN